LPLLRAIGQYPAGSWLLWAGVAVAVGIALRHTVRSERFLAAAIVLQLVAVIVAYLITPHDVSWQVRWSWERVVLQLVAPIVILAIAGVAPLLPVAWRKPQGAGQLGGE
jgi:hypothetical protein